LKAPESHHSSYTILSQIAAGIDELYLHTDERKNIMAKRDVVVEPGKPLVITNTDRDFGTITIKPGGQVSVETTAQVTVDHLVKE
jgi:hypothetical protein